MTHAVPQNHERSVAGIPWLALRADCANCFGLCCVALPFTASADSTADKEPREPCTDL